MAILMLIAMAMATASCGQNAFLESAKRDSDAALLFEAQKLMNKSQWTEAIEKLQLMSVTGRAKRDSKAALASAYAGRCGLNLIAFADAVANASGNLFPVFLSVMRSSDSQDISDCISAETTLLSINEDAAARTANENMLMAFVGWAKIGAILAVEADTNDDGSADGGWDACTLSASLKGEIGTGLTISVASLAQTGTSVGGTLSSSINSICTTLGPSFDFCSITDSSAFTSDQLRAIGALTKSTDQPGVGTCAGNVNTCICP
jgi:hypothetical protein